MSTEDQSKEKEGKQDGSCANGIESYISYSYSEGIFSAIDMVIMGTLKRVDGRHSLV